MNPPCFAASRPRSCGGWLRLVAVVVAIVWSCVSLAGCTRQEKLSFSASDSAKELPEAHQAAIHKILTTYFGSVGEPKWMLPTGEFTEDEQPILAMHRESSWLKQGAAAYQRRCAGCHGITGDGQGEAAVYLNPQPRDYRRGVFKFTSTPYGFRPRREDLIRTIRRGAKGTSMPDFRWLSQEEMQPLVDYVMLLSYRGEMELLLARELTEYLEDEELEEGLPEAFAEEIHDRWQKAEANIVYPEVPPPPYSDETIEAGRQLFVNEDCAKCHGRDGRGQTDWLSPQFIAQQEALPEDQRIQINRDAWGHVAPAADLTAGMLHGGRRPIDIYRRIYSGINGTPMPGFANKFSGEDRIKIWHLAHFVISLTEGREFDTAADLATADADAADSSSSSDEPTSD